MSNETESIEKSDGSDRRRGSIGAILDVYRQRRAAGESISDIAIMAEHPDLMPELGDELRKLRLIAAAREQAFASPNQDSAQTVEHRPSRKDSRGLHMRCPHCSNFVEVVTDTPYEEICCSSCGSSFSLVDRDDSTRMATPLKSIGRFDLVTRLGVGGFGTVWKAHDRELDRTVAVKIPRRGQLDPAEIDQFFREARAAAQLRHPNIVPVHEVGRDGETLFIVSDLVRGATLTDWLTGSRLSTKEIAELCIPVADALHHAHQQGVVHRDLKPSNIMIDESGRPHLTDFGLAKREVGEITMTVDGQILGTPAYMSPEQASGQGHWTDRRTDIYSFGVILFQLLTDELPFRGNAQMQILRRRTEDAPDPRKLNRHIPRDMSTICLKCLEREPGRRYATAADVEEEIKRFLRGEPIHARPLSSIARVGRWAQRKPWVAATAALTVFLAIAGPIAAVQIYLQGRQLETRLQERNQFITNAKTDLDLFKTRVQDLEGQLAVWNGKAKPSEFWPPKKDEPPRQMLIADLFERSADKLRGQLRSGNYDLATTARGYLALATMADELKNHTEAVEYYESARDALVALHKNNPERAEYGRALAQCNTRLSELSTDDDRQRAAKESDAARSMYQQLATKQKSNTESQIEWIVSELNNAMLGGYDIGETNLMRASQIKNTLSTKWPTSPDAIYRTACFLSRIEPILLPPTAETPKQAAAAP